MNSFEKLFINNITNYYKQIEPSSEILINDRCYDNKDLKNVFVDLLIDTEYPDTKIVISMGVNFLEKYTFDGRIELCIGGKRYNFVEMDHDTKDVVSALEELYEYINTEVFKFDLQYEMKLRAK